MQAFYISFKLQELNMLLSRPLQPRTFSRRYLAGVTIMIAHFDYNLFFSPTSQVQSIPFCLFQAGVSPLLQHQFEELARQKLDDCWGSGENKRRKLVVIGQNCVEPLQALRSGGHEVACLSISYILQLTTNSN